MPVLSAVIAKLDANIEEARTKPVMILLCSLNFNMIPYPFSVETERSISNTAIKKAAIY